MANSSVVDSLASNPHKDVIRDNVIQCLREMYGNNPFAMATLPGAFHFETKCLYHLPNAKFAGVEYDKEEYVKNFFERPKNTIYANGTFNQLICEMPHTNGFATKIVQKRQDAIYPFYNCVWGDYCTSMIDLLKDDMLVAAQKIYKTHGEGLVFFTLDQNPRPYTIHEMFSVEWAEKYGFDVNKFNSTHEATSKLFSSMLEQHNIPFKQIMELRYNGNGKATHMGTFGFYIGENCPVQSMFFQDRTAQIKEYKYETKCRMQKAYQTALNGTANEFIKETLVVRNGGKDFFEFFGFDDPTLEDIQEAMNNHKKEQAEKQLSEQQKEIIAEEKTIPTTNIEKIETIKQLLKQFYDAKPKPNLFSAEAHNAWLTSGVRFIQGVPKGRLANDAKQFLIKKGIDIPA